VLKRDPLDVYDKMDYKTKDYYRNKIKELSKETKISEIYIANKALDLATNVGVAAHSDPGAKGLAPLQKKAHIGYYLISDGINELKHELGCRGCLQGSPYKSAKTYIGLNVVLTTLLSILLGVYTNHILGNVFLSIIVFLLAYIPISEICIQTINYILSKKVKPTLIPKMDFTGGVPSSSATFVVIPTILSSVEKVEELARKLEVYYLANKSENIYFAILGDCIESKNEVCELDEKIVSAGIQEVKRLNEKYNGNKDGVEIFHFLYRRRQWNSSEQAYIGWERKRGLICEFNQFLLENKNNFKTNTIASGEVPEIQYVITLDSDTNLVLDSAFELIGSCSHILNMPVVDKKIVVEGYGIIQPRIGTDLVSSRKNLFTKIYSEEGGTDAYANAISDVYQDNFGEGIFTGKGIYNLKVFHEVLHKQIPENTVLSHDLLEGSYLRCGLATDILLLDSSPAKYISYMNRLSRWIRGDWQISKWLGRRSPLNLLSKFKILDNLRRSLIPTFALGLLLFVGMIGIVGVALQATRLRRRAACKAAPTRVNCNGCNCFSYYADYTAHVKYNYIQEKYECRGYFCTKKYCTYHEWN